MKRRTEYKIIYGPFSDIAHGGAFRKQLGFKSGMVVFEPIRHLEGIDVVLKLSIFIAIRIYSKILEKFRPDELPSLRRKYINEWKERFSTITRVSYKVNYGDPI